MKSSTEKMIREEIIEFEDDLNWEKKQIGIMVDLINEDKVIMDLCDIEIQNELQKHMQHHKVIMWRVVVCHLQ